MNTMNVNGQNGVATSAAIKNAVVKAVKMINKAENAKRGYVMIGEGTRLSFDGQRFIKGGKDNFIFNGWIEYKGSNGRYYEVINVSYKNLDNEEGLCLNDMVNAVLNAILNYIDSTIVKCEGSDYLSTSYAETLQLFRYCYFGSKLVVDNTDNLNSPDALNNDIESIMEFFGNDYKALNDIENEFFGYHFDIDNDLRDNLLFKRNGTFIDMYYKNMDIINNSEYIRLTDIKNIRDFENALYELISTLINDNDENDGPDAMTIREYFEKHKIDDGWGTYVTADPINNYVDEFLRPDAVKTFFNLVEKDEDWSFYIDEDANGDLYLSGNEGIYKTYFDDDVPMIQVYSYLIDKMNEEIIKTETEIEGAEK